VSVLVISESQISSKQVNVAITKSLIKSKLRKDDCLVCTPGFSVVRY